MRRASGAGLLAEAGEQDQARAALARYALGVAEQAGAAVQTTTRELAGVLWLDAEDATMAHVLAWAVEHDPDTAVRLVTALSVWWVLRGRLAGQGPLLHKLAGQAGPASAGWCAAQVWLAWAAFGAADLPQALQRCAAVMEAIGDREPSRLLVDCLTVQSETLANLGRVPEAAECGRRARPRFTCAVAASARPSPPPPTLPVPPAAPAPGPPRAPAAPARPGGARGGGEGPGAAAGRRAAGPAGPAAPAGRTPARGAEI